MIEFSNLKLDEFNYVIAFLTALPILKYLCMVFSNYSKSIQIGSLSLCILKFHAWCLFSTVIVQVFHVLLHLFHYLNDSAHFSCNNTKVTILTMLGSI